MRTSPAWYWKRFLTVSRRGLAAKVRQFRRWLEHTSHLEHLSVLLFTPVLIAVVTLLSHTLGQLSFLLFPPLASGTYTLFADPESPYSDPVKFVGGMTLGATVGWVSLEFVRVFGGSVGVATGEVTAIGAGLGLLLTGLLTWALDLEEPTAFSTALLVLITGSSQLAYVVGVAVSSTFVAAVFVLWRDNFFEQRARYLYSTTGADDHVLVPMLTDYAPECASFGARMAASNGAGKVVLLELVDEQAIAEAERELLQREEDGSPPARAEYIADAESVAEERAADWAARTLEQQAAEIEANIGVPCEVVVAVEEEATATSVVDAADRTDCDLVVAPYEYQAGEVPDYIRDLFGTGLDVIAFRGFRERTSWQRVLVAIDRPGDLTNAMMDYAARLTGETGTVSACSCIDTEEDRRRAERLLADVVDASDAKCETRIARTSIEAFLERNDREYDLVMLGASTDRSTTSRLFRSPTYEAAAGVETDLVVVHHR